MKQIKPILYTVAAFALLIAFSLVAGCVKGPNGEKRQLEIFTPLLGANTNAIENKAYGIARVISAKRLRKHPERLESYIIARDDLEILERSPNVGVEDLMEIVNRLPPDAFKDEDTALYIEVGMAFLSDGTGKLALDAPAKRQSAARGGRRALDASIKQFQLSKSSPDSGAPGTNAPPATNQIQRAVGTVSKTN